MRLHRLLVAVSVVLAGSLVPAAAGVAAPYADGQVIVKYRAQTTTAERLALFERTGVDRTLGTVQGIGARVVKADGDAAAAAARLERSAHVAYAEPNYLMRATATPDDPLFAIQYGLHNAGQTGGTADADIDAPEGWDALGVFPATGGARVAIVDTGVDLSHPDLQGKVDPADCAASHGVSDPGGVRVGTCADDGGHGTHVAGTLAANTGNALGVGGVSFNSPLVVCRALGGELGGGTVAEVVNCIDWAASRGVRVMSLSFGGPDTTSLRTAVANVWNGGSGAVVLASAGNDGDDTVNYPAGYDEVVSVASTDHDDAHVADSNANADVEVAAPGEQILSTFLAGDYATFSGTSMATPHAAGVAAVIATLNPALNAAGLRTALQAAVDDLGPPGRDPEFGFGRVNLCRAVGGACAYTPGG